MVSGDEKIDINNSEKVTHLLRKTNPTEIYYLAAFHHSSENASIDEGELFQLSYQVHSSSLVNFLEALRKHSPTTKFFSQHHPIFFGDTTIELQNELSPINPNNIYGITKATGVFMYRYYRNKYSLFISVGILYNHESQYRLSKFVSMKIITGALRIKKERTFRLELGDLDAEVDWGYAPDYVDAMYRILLTDLPDDFIIATGEKHSVREFVKSTFECLGLDWKSHINENNKLLTKKKIVLVGDTQKLKK